MFTTGSYAWYSEIKTLIQLHSNEGSYAGENQPLLIWLINWKEQVQCLIWHLTILLDVDFDGCSKGIKLYGSNVLPNHNQQTW